MHSFRVMAFVLVVLLISLPAWGQTGTSTIRGTVTDPQGRVVAGADVTLTNRETNAVRTSKTTDTGAYAFELIVPGTYRIEVASGGFRTKAVDNVHALVGKATETNVQLEVGAAGEVVEVRSSSQEVLVNTQDGSLGNVFVTQQIGQLPLEARSLGDLLSLQPGVTREGYVTGARADQSNITLDGVDINNAQTGNVDVPATNNTLLIGQLASGDITNGPVLRLNSEAIDEFRVTTANGNANQGRSSGSQVNLVTKSGTNNWHAGAFEVYRSRGFTANDWFNNHATDANGNWAPVPRPPLQRNTFSGWLGGPVVKNKVFFFYNYEGRRDSSSQAVTTVVPLATLGQGILNYTYCTDATCTTTLPASLSLAQSQQAYAATNGLNSDALQALADAAARYPANDTSQGDGLNTGGFRFNAPTPVKLNSHVAKLDFNLTSHQSAFVRLNVIHDHQTLPKWLPDSPSPLIWNHPRGLAVAHTWTIGSHWVNNFRYGYTRQAFTRGGDSFGNDISFRFVFQPTSQVHTLDRITPVHNFTDDISWVRGNHTIQFGVNIRKTNNSRISFANAFDNAVTNPSFYLGAGEGVSDQFQAYLTQNGLPGDENTGQSLASISEIQNAATAVIGRFSQYTANFTFSKDGTLLPAGSSADRDFATQAYDSYIQDSWKIRRNFTLSLGLRYSLERPVYETHGFEVQPTVPLGDYFAQRLAAARNGQNFIDPIVINRSGPANGGKPMYNWDKNNFQPRVAFAWSLDSESKSVLRGGFALTNDYYGQALAVDWDLNNTLGFTSNFTTPANTFDTTPGGANGLAPLFTGFNQDVQSLPLVSVPGQLTFPLQQDSDYGERIESSVDSKLHAPTEYVWNLTFERQLAGNSLVSFSYIGRAARGLLAQRDAVAFNNLVDPQSGMDWYTAGTMLEKQRQQGVDTSQIATIPFFENLYPAGLSTILNNTFGLDPVCGGSNPGFDPTWTNTQTFYALQSRTPSNPCAFFGGNDWTDTQALLDQVMDFIGAPTLFMQPQYGSLSAWSTVGNSNYNALAVSFRTRLSSLTMDFNYTWSHSQDDASGLQGEVNYNTAPFIVNPIRQGDNYGSSSFDIRHNITADALWHLPFGKGRALLGDASPAADAILGGWQLGGIFRWNTGLPQFGAYDDARWATNWNVQAFVTPTRPIPESCSNRPTVGSPKLFGGCDVTQIFQTFRNAYPGETGPRNPFRLPSYISVDLGLSKAWTMPWNENHHLQLRWDVFNVTNTQRFGAIDTSRTGLGIGRDPGLRQLTPPDNWSNFIQIQGQPRVMQIGVRYAF
jgi:carboxypeptidase family protein